MDGQPERKGEQLIALPESLLQGDNGSDILVNRWCSNGIYKAAL